MYVTGKAVIGTRESIFFGVFQLVSSRLPRESGVIDHRLFIPGKKYAIRR